MQKFKSRYVSKEPNAQGFVDYTVEENAVWAFLYARQMKLLDNRACQEYMEGLNQLQLTADAIPQLPEVNDKLSTLTGWQVSPVTALISAKDFFELLANKRFPAATFIRTREEIDYVKEPDIFHEIFGHGPMLTHRAFTDFMQAFGQLALSKPKREWPLLLRLFWFTVEFGLIETPQGLRAYGGGILSSKEETCYSVESTIPERLSFSALDALRTPYRIDMLQVIYYVIQSYDALYTVLKTDITALLKEARQRGEFEPKFPVEHGNPSIYVGIC